MATDSRYSDCSSNTNPYSTSRLKKEPNERYSVVHGKTSEVRPHPRLHATKDIKCLRQDMCHNARGGPPGPRGDVVCPLLGGLVLGKAEPVHSIVDPVPVQMVLEQRTRLCMMEAPYSRPPAAYPPPAEGHQQHRAVELEPRSADEDRKMWIGMGVGVGPPAQSSYMSLNFHQVLGKRSSFKAPPLTTLSHITDGYGFHGKEAASFSCNSPSSSSSPDSHREIPYHTNTSVIITNER